MIGSVTSIAPKGLSDFIRPHGGEQVLRQKQSFRDVTQFWEDLEHELSWMKPHVQGLTKEQLKERRNQIAKVDDSNPIWLEAPLRRLRMQMTPTDKDGLVAPAVATSREDPKEAEARAFRKVVDVLSMWDADAVRDPEQFVITLQQVLKHSHGIKASQEVGGMSLLLHVIKQQNVRNAELLLDCWGFVLFEFKEMVAQLSPLVRFMDEMRTPIFKKFLKTTLIFVKDFFPKERVEGFNLYLLGEVKGALLREMMRNLQKYDPEGTIITYLQEKLYPIAEKALALVETNVDRVMLQDIADKMKFCRMLASGIFTEGCVKLQLTAFLEASKPVVDMLLGFDADEMAKFLGFNPAGAPVHGVPPPAAIAPVVPPAPPVAGVAPPPPPAGSIPVPPPLPPAGWTPMSAPPATPAVVPPPPPPLPPAGMLAMLASQQGVQPRLFPSKALELKRFFRCMVHLCSTVGKSTKRAAKGELQVMRIKNYILPVAKGGLWKEIKDEHLSQLEQDIQSVLSEIKGTNEMDDEETKLLTLVYMVKDLDATPCGNEEETEKNVAKLRWLVDNIYLLYNHEHAGQGNGVLMKLTKYFADAGLDPRRRVAVWETIIGFKNKFEERAKTTDEVHNQLDQLVNEDRIRQLLICTLMHGRQIEGAGIDEDRIEACRNVSKHFALLRLMIDNLCKNYRGILILDKVREILPAMLSIQQKLKNNESLLQQELEGIRAELDSDLYKDLHVQCRVVKSLVSEAKETKKYVVEGTVFNLNIGNVPETSLLYSLAMTEMPVGADEDGNIELDIDRRLFGYVATFLNNGELPSALTTDEWNGLKYVVNYLGLENMMSFMVEYDHIYYDKLRLFEIEANRNIASISPVADDAMNTLEVLTALFRRVNMIYEHIDTRSITNIFASI
eukprot:TRINITY_DN23068_c0_g1_i1.p1 TRINITY_DN23068_c0_g1~~TRINITY_DN23068_c0_g1_i1.p1  ORF type:complete len:899 (+),score=207.84 TRINITY_DN23068_c0_g1_i1:37-2733(+)